MTFPYLLLKRHSKPQASVVPSEPEAPPVDMMTIRLLGSGIAAGYCSVPLSILGEDVRAGCFVACGGLLVGALARFHHIHHSGPHP